MPVTKAQFKKIALSFPGAVESTSYGYPSYKIEKKFFTRLRDEDASLVLIVESIDERDMLIEADPKPSTSPITTRIIRMCWCARAPRRQALRAMLERRWRAIAPKKLLKASGASARKSGDHFSVLPCDHQI